MDFNTPYRYSSHSELYTHKGYISSAFSIIFRIDCILEIFQKINRNRK
ncbi:hypothetical protein RUMLAC_00325 [[Ruminococcus] lactaris ATCC 29176]|uniref:Uncharacterized protein n=1 Tax=[Ruminococcus] lactaris ATCC 29176 TaxID=471875 RepID=B5CLK3_9FIRM|nr:hypothetical protein RUMLAC_00325 [[Ruminococcus] lactaris ATCC 29176]